MTVIKGILVVKIFRRLAEVISMSTHFYLNNKYIKSDTTQIKLNTFKLDIVQGFENIRKTLKFGKTLQYLNLLVATPCSHCDGEAAQT